jgi:DNA modification methylase
VTDASAALCEMQPYLQDADFTLYVGDVREVLAGLPDESVHCVVTSPPYWGLRDYGTGSWAGGDEECDHKGAPLASDKSGLAGYTSENVKVRTNSVPFKAICGKCGAQRVDQQLGLEPTPELYVANMVAVFREVRRVLRRDGTCWLNIGDSYNAGRDGGWAGGKKALNEGRDLDAIYQGRSGANAPGLKPKDLVGIPWRLAFALQAEGWYLRSEIIWAKPNPMPESVTDRPTKSHEQVFLLTRSPRYFYRSGGGARGLYAGRPRRYDRSERQRCHRTQGDQRARALGALRPESPFGVGDRNSGIPGSALRDISGGPCREVCEGGDVGAWCVFGVRRTVGTRDGAADVAWFLP